MAISIATIRNRVYSRLAAELASPTYTQIHENTLTLWADELCGLVSAKLYEMGKQAEYERLIVLNGIIALTAGVGALPTIYQKHLSVRVVQGANVTRVYKIYDDPSDFARWDSSNYILTPTTRKPVALIATGQINVKPTSFSFAYLDYIIIHPNLASYNTRFGEVGDNILVSLLVGRCFDFLEEPQLANNARAEVGFK